MSTVFQEVRLDHLVLNNHLVQRATWENMASEDGQMTEELYKIYETLAIAPYLLIQKLNSCYR